MKNLASKKGFTLIELLIVITIIGILAAALLPNILGAPARARDAARQADMNNVVAAVEAYNADQGEYPPNGCVSTLGGNELANYFSGDVPADPNSDAAVVGGCANTGDYYFCNIGLAEQTYAVVANTERDETANADTADVVEGTNCQGGSGSTAIALNDIDPSGDSIFVLIK